MIHTLTIVVAGIVSVVSSWITIGYQSKRFRKEIENTFNKFLYEERLGSYTEAYKICAQIRREKSPKYVNDHSEVLQISEELHDWASGRGGLLMSGTAINAFQELFEALRKNPGDGDNTYTRDQAQKIWRLRTGFRRALRQDVLVLFPSARGYQMLGDDTVEAG